MAKIATKLLISFIFLLTFIGFFIYWQRSSITALIAYQLLKSEGVYAVEVDVESMDLAAIKIKKAVIKIEGHPFHTTVELNQLRCQLIFYDRLSPVCAPLHIQSVSIRATSRESQTPPSPELVLAMHNHMKKIAAHPVLSQKTHIEQLHLHIEPYALHTLQMKGNLRIEEGQVYLYYQPLKLSFLPFEIRGHLYLLNERTEMALKTEKSHLKTQWVMTHPSQRIHKQLHITANGRFDLTEYQAVHQKLKLQPLVESSGFLQLNDFDLSMPMEFDAQVFKSALFRLKAKVSVDGSLNLPELALSKIDLLSDFFVDSSAEQMNIRFSATDASTQYSNTTLNIHSSDEHTLSWNGNNNWHLNIQSPIHWKIQQDSLMLAQGMAENIIFYQSNQTHIQLTLFNEESSNISLQPFVTQTPMTLPPYQMTARIDQDSKKWLFDFNATKSNSALSAHLTGVYHPEDYTWQSQIKIESALTEISPLLLLLEHLKNQLSPSDQAMPANHSALADQTALTDQSIHSQHLFSLPLSFIQQFSAGQLFYQGALKGQIKILDDTNTPLFFTPIFWKQMEWTFSHDLILDNSQSNQPWLNWNQLHLEVTGQKPAERSAEFSAQTTGPQQILPQQTGHYVLALKQSRFLKSLTDARIEGDFYFNEHAPFAHFERSQATLDLWHGKAKTVAPFSWHPEKASQWALELSKIQINELFKLQTPNRYHLYPDLALGSLTLNASPQFKAVAFQAILTPQNHSDLTDKANHEHFSMPSAQFNFEIDENHLMKLNVSTKKQGPNVHKLLYSKQLHP